MQNERKSCEYTHGDVGVGDSLTGLYTQYMAGRFAATLRRKMVRGAFGAFLLGKELI